MQINNNSSTVTSALQQWISLQGIIIKDTQQRPQIESENTVKKRPPVE